MVGTAELALEAFERGRALVASGNREQGRRWLDRACRLAPRDATLTLAYATACLGLDDQRAADLFLAVSGEHDVREAWLGLATARRRLGDASGAAAALAEALKRHVVDPGFTDLADAITRETDAPGWCGVASDGGVVRRPETGEASISGTVIDRHGRHFLGSPIDVRAINATVGCVSNRDGGIVGWAWHPANPDADPELTIRPALGHGRIRIIASNAAVRIDNGGVLARPRGFSVPAEALAKLRGPLHVLGRDGKDLLGSPLDPRADERAGALAAMTVAALYPVKRGKRRKPAVTAPAIPVAENLPKVSHSAPRQPPRTDVVLPVHGASTHVLPCLDSVLAALPKTSRLIVVDDASPEAELATALDRLAGQHRIRLIRNERNVGFAASANIGLRATRNDVVLLNSDTLVARGWLEELRSVAYGAEDIGTVTPLSNDATILSYPNPLGDNPTPDFSATERMDAIARRANGGSTIDIPVGVGFCLYIKRRCLEDVGLLRADVFAQGYGEENDFCLRARHLGWRHVAAPGVFVAHIGGQSFGAAGRHLRARNEALLERLHPGYARLIKSYADADPLAPARRRLDLARWRAARRRGSEAVILITHAAGGGVERQIAASVERHRRNGYRAIVVRPAQDADGTRHAAISEGATTEFPNLRYSMPDEYPLLRRLLARERPRAIELHHTVGHHPAILDLLANLDVPYEVHVHDYAWLCGRVALVGATQRYCGEPPVSRCEACVADMGNLIDEEIGVAELRERSALVLGHARAVYAPSVDAAVRIRRHFPQTRPVVRPHEKDASFTEPAPIAASKQCRVAIIGAIGIHKGYQVVLDCARDAAERQLALEFVVVGHTIDDGRLLATGRVFVTGTFTPDESITLIRSQNASLAFLPSIWPETWCFTIGEAWRAGLRVAAFDIGAQAERIKQTGRGFVIPLGLAPHEINNALMATTGLLRGE